MLDMIYDFLIKLMIGIAVFIGHTILIFGIIVVSLGFFFFVLIPLHITNSIQQMDPDYVIRELEFEMTQGNNTDVDNRPVSPFDSKGVGGILTQFENFIKNGGK